MSTRHHPLWLAMAALLAATHADAQSIAQRVRAVLDGAVELHYAARPGVCGDGSHYFSIGRSTRMGDGVSWRGEGEPCLPGPVRIRMQLEDGAVRLVRVDVGPARTATGATDLGTVAASAAADYFLELAGSEGTGSGARAITAAVLADSSSVWRRLLAIARDSSTRPRSTRHEATFWLAQFAAGKLDGRGETLAMTDEDDDRDDPKSSAIFALSQLRNREGVEPLLRIARTNREARLRRKALFWLGESGDPRAIALFGEIMSR